MKSFVVVALFVVGTLAACIEPTGIAPAGTRPGSGSGTYATAGSDAGIAPGTPFVRPDYTPSPDNCGFDSPAYCDTFEAGPMAGGRSGELDPTRWSVTRGMPYNSASSDDAMRIGPARIGQCRAELSNTRVLPDSDVLVCDPIPTIPTRHVLATAAAQNYGLSTYRIRQPFDFSGRTGTIKLDLDLTSNALGGWPALIIAQDPSPAPSFDGPERGSGPKNGIEIEFGAWCNTPHTVEAVVYTFSDYQQTAHATSFGCVGPYAPTWPDLLNHVEVYLTQNLLEVWSSDPSIDGSFPDFQRLWEGEIDLPFTRGYVSLALRNHATLKYWLGSAATMRWDNIGFDGPLIASVHDSSAPDSLTTYQGLPGCTMTGSDCQWQGDAIPASPDDSGRVACAMTSCTYDGEGRTVGYVVPNLGEDTAPVPLEFTGVTLADATRARLVLAASYPAFDGNGVVNPSMDVALRFRLNGGAWHDRYITAVEAVAFSHVSPALGAAGAGAGLLNQAIDLDLTELREGNNRIELQAAGTWTSSYRTSITGADLVLD